MRPVLAHNLRLLRFIELHQPIGSARAFAAYDDAGENESAFRQRLSYLCKQGWLISSGHTQNAIWRLDPLQPLPTEAKLKAPAPKPAPPPPPIMPPRSINLMAGVYQPAPCPAPRPGSDDHAACPSLRAGRREAFVGGYVGQGAA